MRGRGRERAVLAFLAVLGLGLTGCALWEAPPTSVITGYVVNANGGEPVPGTQVWLRGLDTNVTRITSTDRRGRFSVRVPPDVYEISLEKEGYAGSRVIGLDAREPVEIRIVQREVFNPQWSTRPPEIELKGIEEGGEYQGEIPFRVDVTADNDVQYIYVALGKTPGSSFLTAPRFIFVETPSTGDQALDPRLFGVRGPTTFEVVVYDLNGNRTHLIKRITVVPPEGLVAPPPELQAVAVTLSKQIQFFGVEGQAVPRGTNLYVELSWWASETPDVQGYRIYRSFDGENFTAIGQVHAGRRFFADSDPRLAVGKWVYYYVTALRGGEESPPSAIVKTRPLPPWDVRLVAPADEAVGVSRTPTFRWEPTREVGLYRLYGLVLWDTVLGDFAFWLTPEPPDFLINRTSYRWNEDGRFTGTPWETLQPNRVYEWEVVYAVALDDLENPTAVSVAVNRFGIEDERVPIRAISLEATDNFSFTTGE